MIKKFWFVLLLSFIFIACSEPLAGGTEAESTIALQVLAPTGEPAAYARARFLPSNYMSDGELSPDWVSANAEGKIEYKTLDTGAFTIEVRYTKESKSWGAIQFMNAISGKKVSVNPPSLLELASIEGTVASGQGPSLIRIAGLERFIVPDSAGRFVVDSLPLGDFELIVESRSNRGTIKVDAETGVEIPALELGEAKGFAVEDFESFSGASKTGAILGDGWWYTLDAAGENIMPLWDDILIRSFSGRVGCASGGCARTNSHLGFLLGLWEVDYELASMDTLYFAAKGKGELRLALAYGQYGPEENGLATTVTLEENWKGYSIAISKMKLYGPTQAKKTRFNRIDFSVSDGGEVFLDDISLGGVNASTLEDVKVDGINPEASVFPGENWAMHASLLAQVVGYGSQAKGGSGGVICLVTTEEDLLENEENAYIVAPGSLRECAMKEEPVWIQFQKSGIYRLQTPLRIKSFKTIDGRGRDVRIAGMGILADSTQHLVFENLRFTSPAITEKDTTSRRALSIHNQSKNVWVNHCTFEDYPLVLLDVKRRSDSVTISWSRFENSQHAILLGLNPEVYFDSLEHLTIHHNYFNNLDGVSVLNQGNIGHFYNNFFMDNAFAGVVSTDRGQIRLEKNIFNITTPFYNKRVDIAGFEIKDSEGYIDMIGNWLANGGVVSKNPLKVPLPSYDYIAADADAALALRIQSEAGPR